MKLIFVRHGRSEHNAGNTDDLDSDLCKAGVEQVERAAVELRRLVEPGTQVTIGTSPYKRCRQSADILRRALGCDVMVLDALREHPAESKQADDSAQALERDLAQTLGRLKERGEDSILVSHLMTIKLAIKVLTGSYPTDVAVGNASVHVYEVSHATRPNEPEQGSPDDTPAGHADRQP